MQHNKPGIIRHIERSTGIIFACEASRVVVSRLFPLSSSLLLRPNSTFLGGENYKLDYIGTSVRTPSDVVSKGHVGLILFSFFNKTRSFLSSYRDRGDAMRWWSLSLSLSHLDTLAVCLFGM